jgi:hypothetical protein
MQVRSVGLRCGLVHLDAFGLESSALQTERKATAASEKIEGQRHILPRLRGKAEAIITESGELLRRHWSFRRITSCSSRLRHHGRSAGGFPDRISSWWFLHRRVACSVVRAEPEE